MLTAASHRQHAELREIKWDATNDSDHYNYMEQKKNKDYPHREGTSEHLGDKRESRRFVSNRENWEYIWVMRAEAELL